MQQLSLEQLEVESYAVQPSEQELTDLKGGTWGTWGYRAVTVGIALYTAMSRDNSSTPETVNVEAYNADSTSVSPSGGVVVHGGDSTKVSISY